MSGNPYDYVMSEQWRQYKDSNINFYRIFFYRDFHDLMQSLYNVYQQYATLEDAIVGTQRAASVFKERVTSNDPQGAKISILESLITLFNANGIPKDRKSACKRLCLFLRWMIRRDGIVDLGVWHKFSPADLLIPLDVHVNRVAREHGLLTRTSADMRAVEELSAYCRALYPDDPAIMDFALFGAGYTSK
jgi:uncharacterized protein (TIGR02757 family)